MFLNKLKYINIIIYSYIIYNYILMKTILLSLILSLTFSIKLQNRDFHVSSMQPVTIINV
jgi:hypothetical protein